ncbi:hypothetical protein CDL15_Pgr004316 [Punica granatum]|uniref:WD repeat-containing protein 13 n=1 Tax=Punica granatum TaxID=22663 RepID=A0A218XF93_PUNGR|nr:hypothetical protein CDL15_Pgr004316 [Punica granatum]
MARRPSSLPSAIKILQSSGSFFVNVNELIFAFDSQHEEEEEEMAEEPEVGISTMAEEKVEKQEKEKETLDPDLFCCLLQPWSSEADPDYVGVRRLLLHRKALSGVLRRRDWRCNGKGYVAYRNYIRRPRNWETLQVPSLQSTPGNRFGIPPPGFRADCFDLDFSSNLINLIFNGRWVPSPNPLSLLYEAESWSSSRDLRGGNLASSHRTSFSSSASDNDRPRRQRTEAAYSFVGMQCIFDQCRASVTVLKFGHMSSDLLAYGASDGSLTVCTVAEPPSVMKQLTGHSKEVTDFDFTSNNQYIASTSADKTVRVWEISKGICIRVIYGVSSQLCIRFHPVNNNFLSVGNANKEITVFNFSTGRIINKMVFSGEVTSMDHDHTGNLIFCGDAKYDLTDNDLCFRHCSVALEVQVTGSEDSNVYFYDLTRPRHTCVNKLQGHRFPVIDVAWNHGENLLASSDLYGTVIVWRRAKTRAGLPFSVHSTASFSLEQGAKLDPLELYSV